MGVVEEEEVDKCWVSLKIKILQYNMLPHFSETQCKRDFQGVHFR